MRTIAVAYRDYSKDEWEFMTTNNKDWQSLAEGSFTLDVEEGLTLVGVFGLRQLLLPGAKEAILEF